MKVFTKENMVFWETVTNAAQYTVYLYIGAKIYYNGSRPNFLAEKHETENDEILHIKKLTRSLLVKLRLILSSLI